MFTNNFDIYSSFVHKLIQAKDRAFQEDIYLLSKFKFSLKFDMNSKFSSIKIHTQPATLNQSTENRRKECNRFWLRLLHAVILISKVRMSASKENKPDGVNPNSHDIDCRISSV